MRTVKRPLGPAVFLLLLTLNADPAVALSDQERDICVAVAKRQAEMFDARIKSGWSAMYSLLTDEYRSRVSYKEFFTSPRADDEERKKKRRKKTISGAKTADDSKEGVYYPVHFGYRFKDFHISDDKNMVRVVSKTTTMAPMFVGPITLDYPDEEFWINTGSGWKAQWDTKYLIHASGAATSSLTPKLPKFTTHVKAAELARWFVEKALKMPQGEKRSRVMEKGMLIDAFAAIEFLAEKKLTAGPPAKERINRQMLAHPASASYFSVNMEAGRWFEMAGDHGASYEKYKMANGIDPYREDALVGIVDEAVKIGVVEEAADYYIKLLKLERLANSRHDTSLERSLSGKCGVCRKLPLEKKLALAKNLARAQKWELAYALFKNIITARPDWPDTAKKLEAGKSVKLKDAVGEVVAGKMRDFTVYELQKILQAGKITLYHPGDMPEKIDGVGGSLIFESAPKIRLQIYEGFYKTDFLPARAAISWDGMDSSNSSTTQGGYLAVIIKKGAAPLKKFYPDAVPHIAGNRRLIDDLESLKRGESILLARVSIFNTHIDVDLLAALSTVGVDAGSLQGPMGAHVIMGTKGMPPGMGKLFKGDYSVRKVFTPPNMDDAKRTNAPALVLTGTGEDATIKYIARKK